MNWGLSIEAMNVLGAACQVVVYYKKGQSQENTRLHRTQIGRCCLTSDCCYRRLRISDFNQYSIL